MGEYDTCISGADKLLTHIRNGQSRQENNRQTFSQHCRGWNGQNCAPNDWKSIWRADDSLKKNLNWRQIIEPVAFMCSVQEMTMYASIRAYCKSLRPSFLLIFLTWWTSHQMSRCLTG